MEKLNSKIYCEKCGHYCCGIYPTCKEPGKQIKPGDIVKIKQEYLPKNHGLFDNGIIIEIIDEKYKVKMLSNVFTLEKHCFAEPKFKIGDKVKHITNGKTYEVKDVNYYFYGEFVYTLDKTLVVEEKRLQFCNQVEIL